MKNLTTTASNYNTDNTDYPRPQAATATSAYIRNHTKLNPSSNICPAPETALPLTHSHTEPYVGNDKHQALMAKKEAKEMSIYFNRYDSMWQELHEHNTALQNHRLYI